MGTTSWAEIQARIAKQSDEEREAGATRALASYERERTTFFEAGRARDAARSEIAESSSISIEQLDDIERRAEDYIRAIRNAVEALGGRLRLVASFPNGDPVDLESIAWLDESRTIDHVRVPSFAPPNEARE